MRKLPLCVASVLMLALASSVAAQKTDAALDKARTGFVDAFNKKDAAQVAEQFAEDGVLMPPDQPMVRGRANIQAFYEKMLAQNPGRVEAKPIESRVMGDTAFEVGTTTLTLGGGGGLMTMGVGGGARVNTGKYAVILKRAQGDWKVAYLVFNNDKPAPTPPTK